MLGAELIAPRYTGHHLFETCIKNPLPITLTSAEVRGRIRHPLYLSSSLSKKVQTSVTASTTWRAVVTLAAIWCDATLAKTLNGLDWSREIGSPDQHINIDPWAAQGEPHPRCSQARAAQGGVALGPEQGEPRVYSKDLCGETSQKSASSSLCTQPFDAALPRLSRACG